MKKQTKIILNKIKTTCITCDTIFIIQTVLKKDFKIDVCSHCHPFYLGTQKFESKAGRMERFRQLEKKTQNKKNYLIKGE